ncbi:MAG: hypothetical protein N2Z65_06750, partial [Clostridiales bacterium]|nr:hypothetical protein [Clostridiales bacterium]
VQALCKLAGRKIEFMGKTYDLFPTPGEIANLSLSDLQCIKAGYRTPYILEAAKAVLSGEMNFNKIKALSTDEGRREMMKLPGVGEKVADCFLLFGLSKFDAFPKDVWIKKTLAAFPSLNASRFGEFAGIAQQYLFYYARETGLDLESLNRERKTAASCV